MMGERGRILFIRTGGTICQRSIEGQGLVPVEEDYTPLIKGLEEIAAYDSDSVGLLDSTDMLTNARFFDAESTHTDRGDIARKIHEHYDLYDGFVIAHGTDTMVESAAALTYMLEGLGKPVVLTGAQKPIWYETGKDSLGKPLYQEHEDGPDNVRNAFRVGKMDLAEVVIAFHDGVFRGTRAKKIDEEARGAFGTFDYQGRLAEIRSSEPRVKMLFDSGYMKRCDLFPTLFTDFDPRVFHYVPVSGASFGKGSPKDELLCDFVSDGRIQAIMFGGFGAGNVPSSYVPLIEHATAHHVPFAVYTRCDKGFAEIDVYAVGVAAAQAGAFSAEDMTSEALGQKLMYALGLANKKGLEGDVRRAFVQNLVRTPINGDITLRGK